MEEYVVYKKYDIIFIDINTEFSAFIKSKFDMLQLVNSNKQKVR